MGDSKPKAYLAWFCPFARRAWISLLAKKVDFEYVEQNPYERTPEWLAISPYGLVPAIIDHGKSIYESAICIEYIDEAFQSDVSLMPKDPYQRAHARIWGDFIGKKVVPHVFGVATKPTEEERAETKEKLLEGLKKLTKAISSDHMFFQQDTLSYVDIMFAPFIIELKMLKDLDGFEVPDSQEFQRFHKWRETISSHPAVAATVPDHDRFLEFVKKYAEKKRAAAVAANAK